MGELPVKHYLKQAGLTLIEVLIALAIAAIALTAVIKATSQNIRGTSYLQDKTIAMWVGQEVLAEARVGLLPVSDEVKVQATSMLGRDWYWRISKTDTPNKRIKKILVDVFSHDPTEDDNVTPLVTLESYVYREE